MQNCVFWLWPNLLRQAGLSQEDGEQFHFHALRHFAASWMTEHRISLADVAALMGHNNFDVTLQVSAHPIVGGGHRHAAMDRMASALLLSDATEEIQVVVID